MIALVPNSFGSWLNEHGDPSRPGPYPHRGTAGARKHTKARGKTVAPVGAKAAPGAGKPGVGGKSAGKSGADVAEELRAPFAEADRLNRLLDSGKATDADYDAWRAANQAAGERLAEVNAAFRKQFFTHNNPVPADLSKVPAKHRAGLQAALDALASASAVPIEMPAVSVNTASLRGKSASGSYLSRQHKIVIDPSMMADGRQLLEVFTHELGHAIEQRRPAALKAATALLTSGKTLVDSMATNRSMMSAGFTEIISTGLDYYMRSPATLARDAPEQFAIIHDLLQGRL